MPAGVHCRHVGVGRIDFEIHQVEECRRELPISGETVLDRAEILQLIALRGSEGEAHESTGGRAVGVNEARAGRWIERRAGIVLQCITHLVESGVADFANSPRRPPLGYDSRSCRELLLRPLLNGKTHRDWKCTDRLSDELGIGCGDVEGTMTAPIASRFTRNHDGERSPHAHIKPVVEALEECSICQRGSRAKVSPARIQPVRKATPPSGVIAPSHRAPVKTMR